MMTFSLGITNLRYVLVAIALVFRAGDKLYGISCPESVSNLTGASLPIIRLSTYVPAAILTDCRYPNSAPLYVLPTELLS